jgi:chorismate synthase
MTLQFLTAGESHGPAITAILEGMPAGLTLSPDVIDRELLRRQQGYGAGPRMKIEQDRVEILGGVLDGVTIGAPIALQIDNKDHRKWKGKEIDSFTIPRPGHSDLTGAVKYGYRDLRPALERASARETAARVAVGAICKHFLAQFDIIVGGYVVSIGDVDADIEKTPLKDRPVISEENDLRCPDVDILQSMRDRIEAIIKGRNTLGGIIEVFAAGLPPGLGSHVQWNRRLESRLGAAILSVQAIKGVEFGPAFENTRLPGTEVHDSIRLEEGRLIRATNRAGGLEGGMTNGEPLIIRAAMKPIATTLTPQQSVDLSSGEEVTTAYERSDFCPVPRAVPILEAMMSFVITDELIGKLGGDSLDEMKPRFEALRRMRLSDLPVDKHGHIFWPAEEQF